VIPVGSEQSNTSIRVGASLVFKLFRRLPTGENPEVERGRFLTTRTAFRATPALHGSLTYIDPSGQPATLGVLQAWVEGARDGWEYITTGLVRAGDETTARELTAATAQLGATTASFHAALASDTELPTFRPEMIEPGDLATWSSGLSAQASRSTDLVRRNGAAWAGDTRALGEAFLALAAGIPAIAADFAREPAQGLWKIRVHGDYHLGQTLKTPDGFTIIDFEGEPSRPLDERRRKLCALKDVAGMLRSFDYAVETVRRRAPAAARTGPSSIDLRRAFLTSYLEAAHRASVACVPRERETAERWLTFFEFDKALYELEYEINNRPEWVDIPLRWIVRNLEAQRGRGQ
jgi:maltose alpha-D-glucosyltransferase/alpha-amylase